MRVSTSSLYLNNLANMMAKQSSLNKIQEQLSSMRRVNSPSDDPVAAAQILDQTQADNRIVQFNQNAKSAESAGGSVTLETGDAGVKIADLNAGQGGELVVTFTDYAGIKTQATIEYKK